MNSIELSDIESRAIFRALEYSLRKWDWESSILLGFARHEFLEIVQGWPSDLRIVDGESSRGRAALGVLREMTSGACALSRERFEQVVGIGKEPGSALAKRLALVVQQ